MIQRAASSFRTFPSTVFNLGAINVQDLGGTNVGGGASWTQGNFLIDQVKLQPPNGATWEVNAFSVSANLWISTSTPLVANQIGPFGRLSKLWASLLTDASGQMPTLANEDFSPTPGVLPSDTSTSFVLWDPDSDPLPPQVPVGTAPIAPNGYEAFVVSGSLTLPEPIEVRLGSQLMVALWLLPSIIGFLNMTGTGQLAVSVQNAAYTVLMDDRKPTPPVML